jgi:hypothetical protein
MGRNWLNLLEENYTAWRVPATILPDLTDTVESAEEAQANAVSPSASHAARHLRDRYVADMVAFMRDIRNRYFFIPPMNEENFLQLGLPLRDTVRTPHVNVTEEVDFVLEIQGIRQVHVRFWVKGRQVGIRNEEVGIGFLFRLTPSCFELFLTPNSSFLIFPFPNP